MNNPHLNNPYPNERCRLTIPWQQLQKGALIEDGQGSVVYYVPVVGRVWIATCLIEEANYKNGQVHLVLKASKLLDGQDHYPHWYCVALEDNEDDAKPE